MPRFGFCSLIPTVLWIVVFEMACTACVRGLGERAYADFIQIIHRAA